MNMQEGDSKRDRPRRLTELKGTEWHPEPQDGDWGQPSPNSQQAGRVLPNSYHGLSASGADRRIWPESWGL